MYIYKVQKQINKIQADNVKLTRSKQTTQSKANLKSFINQVATRRLIAPPGEIQPELQGIFW